MIPISSVRLDSEAERLVLEVIRSGMIAQGPMVQRFEEGFADLIGVKHAVAVNNGTTALVAALELLDLQPGDEVITSPVTFAATLNAILEAGATAKFVDVRTEDFCLDPDQVAAAITPKTKVLLPVHLYGQAADMPRLSALAAEHNLHLVEDAAQAHAAKVDGRSAGTYGIGCFSFYGTKNLTTGEGGMVTTNDDDLADRLRVLRNQGMRQRYQYEVPGHNWRLTDLAAALVIPQLATYAGNVAQRHKNAARLNEGLSGITGLTVPQQLAGREHVWHQYTVLVNEDAPVSREEFVERLTDRGVGSGSYYPKLVFDYDCYRSHPNVVISDVPVAERVVSQCVSLPVHAALSDEDVDQVITAVREVMKA